MNLDNAETRRSVEICYRTRKTLVNPIIDWDDAEVWEFLNEIVKVPHCKLYDEGFTRIGCIGCPMGDVKGQKRDFERWPKYKAQYIRAIEKGAANRRTEWKTMIDGETVGQSIFRWWTTGRRNKDESAGEDITLFD